MDPKNILTSKTIIWNLLMTLVALGVINKVPLTQDQLGELLSAIAVLWGTGSGIIRMYTSKPVALPGKGSSTTTSAVAVLLLPLLFLAGCNTTGTVGKLATDKRLAQAEAVLAAANAAAQVAISDGLIKAADAPKVQAAIDAANFAIQQAKEAMKDGKLDVTDAITAAIAASATVPVIIAEYKSGK